MRTWHSLVAVITVLLAVAAQGQCAAAGLQTGQVVLVRGTLSYDVLVFSAQSRQPASRVSHDITYLTRYRVLQTAAGRVTGLRAYVEAVTDIARGEDGRCSRMPAILRDRELTIRADTDGTPRVTTADGRQLALGDEPSLLGVMALLWPGNAETEASGQTFAFSGEALPALLGLDRGAIAQLTATVQPAPADGLPQSVSLAFRAEQTVEATQGKYLIALDGDYQFDRDSALARRLLLAGTVTGTASFGPAGDELPISVRGPLSMRFDYFALRD